MRSDPRPDTRLTVGRRRSIAASHAAGAKPADIALAEDIHPRRVYSAIAAERVGRLDARPPIVLLPAVAVDAYRAQLAELDRAALLAVYAELPGRSAGLAERSLLSTACLIDIIVWSELAGGARAGGRLS